MQKCQTAKYPLFPAQVMAWDIRWLRLFAKKDAKVVMTARGKKLDTAVQKLREKGYDVIGVAAEYLTA